MFIVRISIRLIANKEISAAVVCRYCPCGIPYLLGDTGNVEGKGVTRWFHTARGYWWGGEEAS